MTSFPQAIRHGLRNLANFRGRDTRSQFWFYMLGLVIAYQLLSVLMVLPIFAMHVASPDPIAPNPAGADAFAGTVRYVMIIALAAPIIVVGLTAAAITRRLHDRGLSGGWGTLPLPFLIFGSVSMYRLFSSVGSPNGEPDHRLFAMTFANNGIYLLTILVLIVLLVKQSDPGSNRFGPTQRDRSEER